jgi:hypothetical protein
MSSIIYYYLTFKYTVSLEGRKPYLNDKKIAVINFKETVSHILATDQLLNQLRSSTYMKPKI